MSTGPLRPDAVSAFVRLARAVPADPTDKPKHHSFFLVTGLILRLAGRISQDAGLPPADRGEVLRDPTMAVVPVQVFLADGYRPYIPQDPGHADCVGTTGLVLGPYRKTGEQLLAVEACVDAVRPLLFMADNI